MEILKGYIDRISYQNEENGYTVMSLVTSGGSETCVGMAKGYDAGETVELEGEYVEHAVYGRQLKFSSIRSVPPVDRISVIRYLGSGAIRGLGEKMATRIVDRFGEDTFRIMEEEPERLAEVKGVSERMAREITDQLVEKREQRAALLFLQQYGISQALADKICAIYGDELYNVFRNNPYRLAEDVPAVGFKRADAIAQKAGIARDSEYRIRCALEYNLGQLAQEGHCYYPSEELCRVTADMLGLDTELVKEQLPALAIDHRLRILRAEDGERVYLNSYYRAESYCAQRLLELKEAFHRSRSAAEPAADAGEGIELDTLQKEAVRLSADSGVLILSGGPGTGKTTTINEILKRLEAEGSSFALAAPTGRAAKRIQETCGYEAQTLHRLLEIGPDEDRGGVFRFGKGEDEPLDLDCVIVDEVSMVDIHLLRALLAAIPNGARLILVGDVDQLPSVGPGQVLRDIMNSEAFPVVRLKKVFRQAGESHIVSYAHCINRGEVPDLSVKYEDFFLLEKDSSEVICHYIVELIRDVLPRRLGLAQSDIQVLTPMRRGNLGVEALNTLLQERLNPPAKDRQEVRFGDMLFREGDRVMQIKNDYQLEWEVEGRYGVIVDNGRGVFNGDTGVVREINSYLKLMKVEFDDHRTVYYPFQLLEELEPAYAVTIHKAQGSEYPLVILPLLSGPRMLMSRNLLYTAVTRAKRCVIILGLRSTVQQMIENAHVQHRYTSLEERIRDIAGTRSGAAEEEGSAG
ncbi:MAG: ATP-dependent RecD-like DNA helicase [Lachnospiraceae bacterium]|nr:ATP-dependent RecD-like DNA helicase [Lachnospiraceae bacterium]